MSADIIGGAAGGLYGPSWPNIYRPTGEKLVENRKELAAALAKAQGEMEGAKKDTANPFHKSKYADLASVWEAIRGPLSANGLSVVQLVTEAPAGFVGLTTILMHSSGQQVSSTFHMPVKDATNPQAVGSALTYARRYALSALVGVAPEDDDGNLATNLQMRRKSEPEVGADYVKKLEDRFKDASTKDQKKSIMLETKSSLIPPDLKTKMLGNMTKIIAEMK